MITFLIGALSGFAITAVVAVWFINSLVKACGELSRQHCETIERLRTELNDLKQEKPLEPGWDRDRWQWRN